MNKFEKTIKICILVFLNILLISCSGANEINTLGIVVSIGLDIDGDDIILTNEIINPMSFSSKNPGTNQEPTKFVISRGKTIEDASINASLTFDRKLYPPHAAVVIIGEELAKRGLDGHIDILTRNNKIRESTLLMVAKDAKAYEVMGVNSGLSNSPGRYIHEVSKQDEITGKQRPINIKDFFKYLYQNHQGQVFGVVEKIDKPTVSKDGKDQFIEVLSMEGGAVFKEGKLAGYFSAEEIIGFKFIVDQYKHGDIVFDTPKDVIKGKKEKESKNKKYSSFEIFKNKTKLDVELIDGKLHLFINSKLRGDLKSTQKSINLNEPDNIVEMEKAIEKKIKKHIEDTLTKGQEELQVDTFDIGEVVHRKYPHIWKEIKDDWTEIFKDLEYTVKIDAKINGVGLTNKSTVIKESIYEQ